MLQTQASGFPATDDSYQRVMVVGGGMAGSILALILGRQGYQVTVFDPKRHLSPVFRNEKLGTEQIALLRELGILSCFEKACWPEGAYEGRDLPSLTDCGAPHHTWLASIREAWPDSVRFIEGVVERIETSRDLQRVETVDGDAFYGRLVVLASGRLHGLSESLGIRRKILSANHSVCLGFSLASDPGLVSQVLHPAFGTGIGYASIFPMPDETRVNVFSYRSLEDSWSRWMSRDPVSALADLVPEAKRVLKGAPVVRRCEARVSELYEVSGHVQRGIVLIGDVFHAPCPASGTGMLRILNDVKLLSQTHIPKMLTETGIGKDSLSAYYRDRRKRRLDKRSLRSSLRGKGVAVGETLSWATWRFLRTAKATLLDQRGKGSA